MSTPLNQPRGKKARGSSSAADSTPPVGLLDAYVDSAKAPMPDESKSHVSTKNKNKKKREQREAEEKRRQSESGSLHPDENDDDEVIESWEEISADNAPQLPKTAIKIETPPKKVVEPAVMKNVEYSTKNSSDSQPKKANKQSNKKAGKGQAQQNVSKEENNIIESFSNLSVTEKKSASSLMDFSHAAKVLADLQETMKSVSEVFSQLPAQQSQVPKAKPAGSSEAAAQPSPAAKSSTAVSSAAGDDEKNRAEVKAEREAKKVAKAAAKEASKAKGGQKIEEPSAESEQPVVEKTREEIQAEREAKKAAKAAAKQGVKVKEDKPVEPPKVEVEGKTGSEIGKSKAELKAERRAKQEAQRAAKELAKAQQPQKKSSDANDKPIVSKTEAANPKVVSQSSTGNGPASTATAKTASTKIQRVSDDIQADRPSVEKKKQRMLAAQQIPPRTKAQKQVMLFKHLHQYERELSVTRGYPIVGAHIHPSVLQLGLQYADGTIQGSNARCVALLYTLKKVIMEHETPPEKEFWRDLDTKLKLYISFLKECRPHSVSMGNAIRTIKTKITSIKPSTSDEEGKEILCDAINLFCKNIELAPKSIARTACEKIKNGDVILTYGCSSLLRFVLLEASKSVKNFRVIVADSRPKLEGREMARHLVNAGIHVTYVHVSAVAHMIKEVTKVFLGAHAVLANGFVMSRVGTAQVALIAKSSNVPVMVCCETYKFSERVQTDSFVFNELGDPDDLIATGMKSNPLEDWRDLKNLFLLNLTYDFTPASLVDAIISEISMIPCTSVPVVLRLKKDDLS